MVFRCARGMDLADGLIRAFGERALVSSCFIFLLTFVGSLVSLPGIGSRMDERFAGAGCCWCFLPFEAVFMMDLRASLGFLMDICRSAEPYLLLRTMLACLIVSLVAMLCSL